MQLEFKTFFDSLKTASGVTGTGSVARVRFFSPNVFVGRRISHLGIAERTQRSVSTEFSLNIGIHMSLARPEDTSQNDPIVFVVDDDISVRESLELLIKFAGWQPETFASAEEFLARPRASAPSCLVLDVSLPDLDGLELQTLIGADRNDMPIIFITGHGDVPMTVQAMKAGAIEFLTKPSTMRCC
jgi:PleD family two-component response regulator